RRSAVEEARRARARPADQPKDSLGFLDLATGEVAKVARVRSFAVPESGGGWAAYLLEADPADSRPAADSAGGARAAGGTAAEGRRERRKEDGTTLVLRNLATGDEHRFERVASYRFSEDGRRLVYAASSRDGESDGVFVVDVASGRSTPVLTGPGVYKQLAFDRSGDQLAFITDRDDHDADHPTFTLYHWRAGQAEARPVARTGSRGLPAGWVVSEHAELRFSDSGRRLFFGTSPRPIPDPAPDTLPPEDERVKLDVWNWRDPFIQPMQLVQAERERRRSYAAVVHLRDGRIVQLGTPDVPDVSVVTGSDPAHLVARSDLPYRQLVSWDGRYADIYLVDVETGERDRILARHSGGSPTLSPGGKYLAWYDGEALAWFALEIGSGRVVSLTDAVPYPIHNELHDRPETPNAYGAPGWTQDDEWFLVYDRYDIWATDPSGRRAPRNVTEGVGRAQ